MVQVPRSVDILSGLVDYHAEINNPADADDVELIKPKNSSWEEFTRQWVQTVAYAENGFKVIKKAVSSKTRLDKCKSNLESQVSSLQVEH